MKKILVIVSAFALSLTASACTHNQGNNNSNYAQQDNTSDQGEWHKLWHHDEWSEQEHMRMMRKMADAMFDKMDKNHDGTVTRKEYEEYSRKWFKEADANHDSKLTRDEFFNQLKQEKKQLMQHARHEDEENHTDKNNENRTDENNRQNQ